MLLTYVNLSSIIKMYSQSGRGMKFQTNSLIVSFISRVRSARLLNLAFNGDGRCW